MAPTGGEDIFVERNKEAGRSVPSSLGCRASSLLSFHFARCSSLHVFPLWFSVSSPAFSLPFPRRPLRALLGPFARPFSSSLLLSDRSRSELRGVLRRLEGTAPPTGSARAGNRRSRRRLRGPRRTEVDLRREEAAKERGETLKERQEKDEDAVSQREEMQTEDTQGDTQGRRRASLLEA